MQAAWIMNEWKCSMHQIQKGLFSELEVDAEGGHVLHEAWSLR